MKMTAADKMALKELMRSSRKKSYEGTKVGPQINVADKKKTKKSKKSEG